MQKTNGRAEDDLALSFGDIVHDIHACQWIFIGWRHNTAGAFPVFAQEQLGQIAIGAWASTVWCYNATQTDTLIKKFPDLQRKLKNGKPKS